jgi:ATP-binding cassette subfamily B protein
MERTRLTRIRFLWSYIRPWKLRLAVALVGLGCVSLGSLIYPWLLRLMVDRFNGGTTSGMSIDALAGTLLGVFTVSSVVGYYQQKEMRMLGYRLRNAVRISLYRSLLEQPMSFHRQSQVGEISARATEDLARLQSFFSGIVSPAFQNALFIAGCITMMAQLNGVATVLLTALLALPIPFLVSFSKTISRLAATSQEHHARANALLTQSLVAIREIKAFCRSRLEERRYTQMLERALDTEAELSASHIKIDQGVYLLFSVALLGIFYAGTRRTSFLAWSLGDIIAFYFYSYTMTMALLSVGRTYFTYQEFAGNLGRVMELLPQEGALLPPPALSYRGPATGKIEFSAVAFSYERARPLLRNITMTLEAGEWHLITGPSGSGKSTLCGLLLGFSEVQEGTIRVDDVPLGAWQEESLRRHIGYVGQDALLLEGTLRENICFLDALATEGQLAHALTVACLDELIRSLPEGLETWIGERGVTLSAGQKARVAIARAILHDPAILILDEANAMLEADLEKRLWGSLARERARKTTIIFSHHREHIPEVASAQRLCDGALWPLETEIEP